MPSYQSVVVLTGAGISAESGIRTFRASDGLWEEHRIEDVATPDGFRRNPTLVHDFYNARRQKLLSPEITYNAAHKALAAFEQRFSGQYLLVTQNIDDLHERAGSQQVVHMHGELLKSRCEGCGEIFSYLEDLQMTTPCPCCQLSGHLRPHIVWFNEIPLALDAIYSALTSCDLFVAIGTSGNVYPAAGFFQEASHHGAHTVELNLEPSVSGSLFKEQHYGPASEVVPRFFAEIA
ncbi:Sir2 family NAD+-dependent deacetylase [Zooshikella ganghwensis]|uniref:NAD-dependent protein deacylase n=1 Tax=Zooshikella ganghwensis TaxID=202772 RepID=A0A4P9VPA6_9GAMM|nr:Sir2 family NAD+-dependent deacetylase [Zooshikella ganghwensis]RDH43950.1 NAD-dependent protein deacylase [Zooshikella ganghwensis]